MQYADFLATKALVVRPSGIDVTDSAIHPSLFPFQRDMVRWSLRKGRAALFETTGLGKTRQQIEWARLTGERALILAPLAVAQQTIREGAVIGVEITYARRQEDAGPDGITITNYEMLHAFDPAAFGAVVLDECFEKGTLVDTPSGGMQIEELIIGDEILNASGIDHVSDVHRREVPYAVRITVNGQAITSSPNHPYFTRRGWVGAQDLVPGDEVLATSEAVRLVRDGVLSEVPSQPRSAILRNILLSEMAYEPAGSSRQGAFTGSRSEARREASSVSVVGITGSTRRDRAYPGAKPDAESRDASESLPPIESDGAQTFRAWGKQSWFDEASTDPAGCARIDLGSGISFVTGQTDSRLSHGLQARLSRSRAANQYRGGWTLPLQPEGRRRKTRREDPFSRVDHLEVLEPGHPDLERLRDADGKLYFYDLGATRHPSFSVNGLLVHNSSILKNFEGKVRSQLIRSFRDTPYRLCATATPAPNDISELANHAEFLGIMKREEMLATFFVHDDTGWRIKGHAREPFYRWLASWGMSLQRPSDLGYSDDGYNLPPLEITACLVPTSWTRPGQLFATDLKGITDRATVRKDTISERVAESVRIVRESWNLNDRPTTPRSAANTIANDGQETEIDSALSSGSITPSCHRKNGNGDSSTTATTTRGPVKSNSTSRLPNEQPRRTKNENKESNSGANITSKTESASSRRSAPITSATPTLSEPLGSNGPMASKSESMIAVLTNKTADAPSAAFLPSPSDNGSTSTMTTRRGLSGGCSASTAIWDSGNSGTVASDYSPPPSISPATLEPWIIWCGLNDEQDAIAAELGDLCISIYGTLPPEEKVARLESWLRGERPVLLTKVSVAGFGLNLQRCARMVFVGLSDSYEQYFQAIRRCWRFGQTRPVHAYIVLTEPEEAIYANVCRKQREAEITIGELVKHVAEFEQAEIGNMDRHEDTPHDKIMQTPAWLPPGPLTPVIDQRHSESYAIYNADSAVALPGLSDQSIDLAVFSPPFSLLYTYSATDRDLGNSSSDDQFWQHFGFISRELLRVMKPGRNVCVHVAQIPSQKAKDGVIGLKDFRGDTIRHFQEAGFVYHGEVCIDKDPQAQAIRTKSKGLLFTQMRKDSVWSRPALADYILIFRAPGENAVPIHPDISNDQWIEWARPIWYGIKETDTLNVAEGREAEDERHICPLQLGTIERCIRLWSNPGETVLTPFLGIGSEVYQAVKLGRRGIGVELKPAYFRAATRNMQRAEDAVRSVNLFSLLDESAS